MNKWIKDESEIDLTKIGDISHILTRNVIIDECLNQLEKEAEDWNIDSSNPVPYDFILKIKSRFEYFKDNFENIIKGQ